MPGGEPVLPVRPGGLGPPLLVGASHVAPQVHGAPGTGGAGAAVDVPDLGVVPVDDLDVAVSGGPELPALVGPRPAGPLLERGAVDRAPVGGVEAGAAVGVFDLVPGARVDGAHGRPGGSAVAVPHERGHRAGQQGVGQGPPVVGEGEALGAAGRVDDVRGTGAVGILEGDVLDATGALTGGTDPGGAGLDELRDVAQDVVLGVTGDGAAVDPDDAVAPGAAVTLVGTAVAVQREVPVDDRLAAVAHVLHDQVLGVPPQGVREGRSRVLAVRAGALGEEDAPARVDDLLLRRGGPAVAVEGGADHPVDAPGAVEHLGGVVGVVPVVVVGQQVGGQAGCGEGAVQDLEERGLFTGRHAHRRVGGGEFGLVLHGQVGQGDALPPVRLDRLDQVVRVRLVVLGPEAAPAE